MKLHLCNSILKPAVPLELMCCLPLTKPLHLVSKESTSFFKVVSLSVLALIISLSPKDTRVWKLPCLMLYAWGFSLSSRTTYCTHSCPSRCPYNIFSRALHLMSNDYLFGFTTAISWLDASYCRATLDWSVLVWSFLAYWQQGM